MRAKDFCPDHDPDQQKGRRSRAIVPELLTLREAMAVLKVSRATVFRLLRMGLPSTGVGRLRRFSREAVFAWWTRLGGLPGLYKCSLCARESRRDIPTPPESRVCQCGARGLEIKRVGS